MSFAFSEKYGADAAAREQKLSWEARLLLHQEKSGPLMEGLHQWMTEQLNGHKTEPNSGLGKAMKYLLRHWHKLTLFLRVPGESMYVPKNLQGWYNGSTSVTLADGRIITPGEFTYLKYNPDYFAAPVVQFPNGQYSEDQYWYGKTAMYPNGLRTPRFSNANISINRDFPIHENWPLGNC